jgi:hypothetical protein
MYFAADWQKVAEFGQVAMPESELYVDRRTVVEDGSAYPGRE